MSVRLSAGGFGLTPAFSRLGEHEAVDRISDFGLRISDFREAVDTPSASSRSAGMTFRVQAASSFPTNGLS